MIPRTSFTAKAKDARYETGLCDIVHFPGDAVRSLRDVYHYERLPAFYRELLQDPESLDRRIIKRCPEIFTWTESMDYFLRPNTPKYEESLLLDRFNNGWRNHGRLYLIAWYVHPFLLPYMTSQSVVSKVTVNELAMMRICDIERASGSEFLATPLDLTPDHLPSLLDLREHVTHELQYTYGIPNPNEADLYFHIYNLPTMVGLHLQVRFRAPLHRAEETRTFYLDEVIDWLASGRTFLDYMDDKRRRAYFFANDNPELMDYLSKVSGSTVCYDVPNPYANTDTQE